MHRMWDVEVSSNCIKVVSVVVRSACMERVLSVQVKSNVKSHYFKIHKTEFSGCSVAPNTPIQRK